MLRTILISLGLAVIATVAVLGVRGRTFQSRPWQFWDDMTDQAKYKPQDQSAFFADGRSQRPLPGHVVAWGYSVEQPEAWMAWNEDDQYSATEFPVAVTPALMSRGQKMFDTYCIACHGAAGLGNGITTQYGMINPPTYLSPRLRAASVGYIYQVISQGKGQMGSYADKIKPPDRWAVVAYVRALQRAGAAQPQDLPPSMRQQLQQPPTSQGTTQP